MSEQEPWPNPQIDEVGGGTRSSQETLCNTENPEYEVNHADSAGISFQSTNIIDGELLVLSENDIAISEMSESFQGLHAPEILAAATVPTNLSLHSIDPSVFINEDTQMFYASSPAAVESPRDITSPCGPGDSSPFEAMESDGLVDPDESIFSASGHPSRRSFSSWHATPNALSTTTPGGSSDEDPYASSGSRKKRRRTRRDVYDHGFRYNSPSSQIPSPAPSGDTQANETEDSTAPTGIAMRSYIVNNSDSNLHATIMNANRRLSNASENSQSSYFNRDALSTMASGDSIINNHSMAGLPTDSSSTATAELPKKSPSVRRRQHHHHHRNVQPASAQSLHTQYPQSACGCSLHILTQPENQHRARYLTEGSRGPVKDSSQQGYPRLQLKGYTGKTTLQVFVGSESDDKIRPHGFYQACKVTGRNTTPCEEVEVEGTKVIHIPFDAQEIISVDCVGILKLRNADVEARIGVTRAKKRSQTVRLVFRVILEDMRAENASVPCILQVVSNRINCTQPPGQPEITKKSLERCPVEGGVEMFIIGRNFHRGLKVIFQDSEEPDGSHWHTQATIDKDTFNTTHMVIQVPSYHDQNIAKPVNVQLYVEHNSRKCDPHSFTFDPSSKQPAKAAKETENQDQKVEIPTDPVEAMLRDGKYSRKYLEALFARLCRSSDFQNNDVKPPVQFPDPEANNNMILSLPTLPQNTQPVLFSSNVASLPSTVQKPVPLQGTNGIQSASHTLIRPNIFQGHTSTSMRRTGVFSDFQNPVVMTPQSISSNQNSTNISTATIHPTASGMQQQVTLSINPPSQSQMSTVLSSSAVANAMQNAGLIVKSEDQQKLVWPTNQAGFPNSGAQQTHPQSSLLLGQPASIGGNVVFSSLTGGTFVSNSCTSQTVQPVNVIQQQATTTQPTPQVIQINNNLAASAQTSTPVQETVPTNPVSFAVAQHESWPGQIVRAAPNMVINNAALTTETFSSDINIIAYTVAQTMATENATPASGSLTTVNPAANIKISQGNQIAWPTSQHPASAPATTLLSTSQNQHQHPVTTQQASNPVFWRGNVQQTQPSQINAQVNVMPAEFILQETGNNQNSMPATTQQHFFALSNSMQIVDQKATSVAQVSNSKQAAGNFSNSVVLLSPNELSNSGTQQTVESLASPVVPSDTCLSVDFGNNFNINDGEAMEHSMLQTIISDCTNSRSSFNIDDSANHGQVEHIFQQQLPVNTGNGTQNAIFSGPQTSMSTSPCKIMQAPLQFVQSTSSDVEMMQVQQQPNKQFVQESQGLQVVQASLPISQKDIQKSSINLEDLLREPNVMQDTNIYLVSPVIQQQPQQDMVTDSSSAQSAGHIVYSITNTNINNNQQNQPMHIQQGEHNITPSNNMEGGTTNNNLKSDFQTIDGTALVIGNSEPAEFAQALGGFSQITASTEN
ncbi:uncharacterized protein LOC143453503 [Clavelina lepadiformis]|uniref:RHD domain-containing protein n=1 Tax=Clavelina lepadiformis TaxID=159417 RepID=A0ABP0H0Z5_CLALP